jgi:uncharacterized repeat protein (TIGR03803 family)
MKPYFVCLILCLTATLLSQSAQAQTYATLYSFSGGTDGGDPQAGLVLDAQGNLYGTTEKGGAHGVGTVFKLDTTGKQSVLYSFTGTGGDGAYPFAGLVMDAASDLYGTTYSGGAHNYGTVFKVDAAGSETVLYSFTDAGGDGAYPVAGLVMDSASNLYGVTPSGGTHGAGTVFKLDAAGNETVLYSFTGTGDDGLFPLAGLVMDSLGNLYSTTTNGGAYGYGTVFDVDTAGDETVLHSFDFTPLAGSSDGSYPDAGLVMDAQGNMYGTTDKGGIQVGGDQGQGTVFKVDTAGKETVLYRFTGYAKGGDGFHPLAGLAMDAQGNLYGTTSLGGAKGQGTVFKLDTAGNESLLYSFVESEGDGYNPSAGLAVDPVGNLYGTTYNGGNYKEGTVYVVLTPAAETTNTLTSSLNPSVYGQAVTFTAVVISSLGMPPDGETVTFMQGKTVLGTGTLSGGSANFTTSALRVGTATLTAVYGGDPKFGRSTSNVVAQVVNKATTSIPTTTILTSSRNPSFYGRSLTFTAIVSSSQGAPPNGETVAFIYSGELLATGTLSGGSASFTTSTLPVGVYFIKAVYGGDPNFGSSTSKTLEEKEGKAFTETLLASSQNPSNFWQAVTFTATVSPTPADGETVTFMQVETVLGTGTLSGGSASFTISTLPVATNRIKAMYYGDSNLISSPSNLVQQVVNKDTTTSALVSSLNPSTYGQAVTWTATVTSTGPNIPTGTVKFGTIGSGKLSGGIATLTKTWLNAATYPITAEYEGDSDSAPSTSSVLDQVVNPVPTTTAITSSANPSSSGQTVTFTATLTSSTGAHATGTVTFTAGTTTLGTVALSGTHASISTAALPAGSTTITATYNGATDYTGSSGSLTQTVN